MQNKISSTIKYKNINNVAFQNMVLSQLSYAPFYATLLFIWFYNWFCRGSVHSQSGFYIGIAIVGWLQVGKI